MRLTTWPSPVATTSQVPQGRVSRSPTAYLMVIPASPLLRAEYRPERSAIASGTRWRRTRGSATGFLAEGGRSPRGNRRSAAPRRLRAPPPFQACRVPAACFRSPAGREGCHLGPGPGRRLWPPEHQHRALDAPGRGEEGGPVIERIEGAGDEAGRSEAGAGPAGHPHAIGKQVVGQERRDRRTRVCGTSSARPAARRSAGRSAPRSPARGSIAGCAPGRACARPSWSEAAAPGRRDQGQVREGRRLPRLELDGVAGRVAAGDHRERGLSSTLRRCATSASRKPRQRSRS